MIGKKILATVLMSALLVGSMTNIARAQGVPAVTTPTQQMLIFEKQIQMQQQKMEQYDQQLLMLEEQNQKEHQARLKAEQLWQAQIQKLTQQLAQPNEEKALSDKKVQA